MNPIEKLEDLKQIVLNRQDFLLDYDIFTQEQILFLVSLIQEKLKALELSQKNSRIQKILDMIFPGKYKCSSFYSGFDEENDSSIQDAYVDAFYEDYKEGFTLVEFHYWGGYQGQNEGCVNIPSEWIYVKSGWEALVQDHINRVVDRNRAIAEQTEKQKLDKIKKDELSRLRSLLKKYPGEVLTPEVEEDPEQ